MKKLLNRFLLAKVKTEYVLYAFKISGRIPTGDDMSASIYVKDMVSSEDGTVCRLTEYTDGTFEGIVVAHQYTKEMWQSHGITSTQFYLGT